MLFNNRQTNGFATRCVRCNVFLPAKIGDLNFPPGKNPYVTCPLCTLFEGVGADELVRVLDSLRGTGLTPYPYQIADARRLASVRAALNGSQMGTGKTITQILGGLRKDMGNWLFVPASVKWNWIDEIGKWRPDLDTEVVKSKAEWAEYMPKPGEVFVASFGVLPGSACKDCKKIKRKTCKHTVPEIDRPFVLACDEIQYLQNPGTQRRRKWDMLRDRVWAAGGRLYGMTGTVVSNKAQDLWEILCAINLGRAAFGTYEHFQAIFWDWFENEQPPRGALRDELLERLRAVRVCRLRRHVLTFLPPVQQKTVRVELTPQIKHEVDEAVQKLLATKRSKDDVESGVLKDPWKRGLGADEKERRLTLYRERVEWYFDTRPWVTDDEMKEAVETALNTKHDTPLFSELSRIRSLLSLAKVSAALEIVEQHEDANEPLIVFCQHTEILKRLFEGREGWALYYGKVPQKERHKRVKQFQAGEIRHGLGISITSGGEGITLTRASCMLRIDLHWNPAKNNQARDRLNRPGAEQHERILITDILTDHKVDRMVMDKLTAKNALHAAVEDDEASMEGLEEFKKLGAVVA